MMRSRGRPRLALMVLSADETRTKIVCTIGPASSDETTLRGLIREGMDVVRFNLSHGSRDEHEEAIARVRRVAEAERATLAILIDLQGPKLRIGRLAEPVGVSIGDWIALTSGPADGLHHVLPLPHPELISGAKVGRRWILDDGAVEGIVREVRPKVVLLEIVVGGRLSSHKGIHAPGGTEQVCALTEKDREDAAFAVSIGADFIALSFVRSAEDLHLLRAHLEGLPRGRETAVVAKIEKREACDALDEILAESDAVMVARGDLGLEVPPQEVPILQKEIIRRCNQSGVPVITATQMLQSMVEHPRPTRAETSDVANAILDGTDAVMLSEETAVGRYPVKSVAMMREISAIVEGRMRPVSNDVALPIEGGAGSVSDAVSEATGRVAALVGARLIASVTASGYTARRVARERPNRPIVALTSDERVLRQLALVWGVVPLPVPPYDGADKMFDAVSTALLEAGYVREGDRIIVTAGLPSGGRGTTNLLKVHRIERRSNAHHNGSGSDR